MKVLEKKMNDTIKWSHGLASAFRNNDESSYQSKYIILSVFRPFIKKYYYAEKIFSDRLTENHFAIFGKYGELENKVIAFVQTQRKPFCVLASNKLVSLALFIEPVQCLPLYRYTSEGKKNRKYHRLGLKAISQPLRQRRHHERGYFLLRVWAFALSKVSGNLW